MKHTAESLDRQLQDFARRLPVAERTHNVAEAIRAEAAASLQAVGKNCPDKQKLAASLRIEAGVRPGEWIVASSGEYGRRLEFGTKISPEWPWFIPALAKVRGLIRNCLQRAPSKGS